MITYLKGDATNPQTPGNNFIIHINNNKGGWGKGFVLAVSKRWPLPEERYRTWSKLGFDPEAGLFEMGNIQKVKVEDSLWVINMVAQNKYSPTYNVTKRYVDYGSVQLCLEKVSKLSKIYGASIHMPRIGTGLGGGKWDEIESIIKNSLQNTPVFVYDL